jgi:hypothetical protein
LVGLLGGVIGLGAEEDGSNVLVVVVGKAGRGEGLLVRHVEGEVGVEERRGRSS